MAKVDRTLANAIERKLINFSTRNVSLPGIVGPSERECLVRQILDSIRRIDYVLKIRDHRYSAAFADVTNATLFDPLKAANYHFHQGNVDEAYWLVFLATHFGKHHRSGWELVRIVYRGDSNTSTIWDWDSISSDFNRFRRWLHTNRSQVKAAGNFSNHRKFESLNAYSATGTGSTIGSYIDWVGGSHLQKIQSIKDNVGENPRDLFDGLYKSLNDVVRFGRIGRFDYLTMIGKLGFLEIEPGSTYIANATGPRRGARLLFTGDVNNSSTGSSTLERNLQALEAHLGLYYGMQVLEDAICNWQKNPSEFIHFRG